MLVRAYTYIRTMGPDGLRAVSDNAVLNANYILKRLEGDYDRATAGPCMHECVVSARRQKKLGVSATDIAKRLLDLGFYAPDHLLPVDRGRGPDDRAHRDRVQGDARRSSATP